MPKVLRLILVLLFLFLNFCPSLYLWCCYGFSLQMKGRFWETNDQVVQITNPLACFWRLIQPDIAYLLFFTSFVTKRGIVFYYIEMYHCIVLIDFFRFMFKNKRRIIFTVWILNIAMFEMKS